jgi:Ca-activated chloride channel homolog
MAAITSFLSQPVVWLALLAVIIALALLARRLRLAWWPAWLLRVGLVSLTLLALLVTQWRTYQPQPLPGRQVMVVDQSDSIAEEARQQALQAALEWQAESGPPDTHSPQSRLVVVFGSEARPLLPETAAQSQESGAPARAGGVDGRASSLIEALDLAGDLLGRDAGQILLASDGLATQPHEVSARMAGLAQQGHEIQMIALTARSMENDLALGSLMAPKNLWAGTPVDLLVPVIGAGSGAPPAQLTLEINGQAANLAAQPAGDMAVSGTPDIELYRYQIPSLPEGMVTLQVTVYAAESGWADPFPGNNSSYAVLQVFPPPRGLLVTNEAGSASIQQFRQALAQQQLEIELVRPEDLSTNLEVLQQYQVILIDNLLSNQLKGEQLTALQVFVSRLAGGLVFLGGRNSYTLGGYEGSPIEAILPVKLEPPPRNQRPPMVFQLVLDRSSSMRVGVFGRDESPIALAREAAIRSIEILQPEDFLGVLTFSDAPNWDIPLAQLGGEEGLRRAVEAVSRVNAFGVTNMYQAMQATLEEMARLPADAPQSRHILLLSDGESTDGTRAELEALAEEAHAMGITVSTIALGSGADERVMQRIAEAGKGRYYQVADARNLPRILVAESKAARSENIQPGMTSLISTEAGHPVLSGMSAEQLPLLSGYNALQSRADEGAEDILVSANFGDPILSAWQYGLGRVAAWTGDLGQEWVTGWQGESEGAFWAQVIRYMLVDPAQSPAQATVEVGPTRLVVEAALFTPDGSPINLAEVVFTFADADNQRTAYRLSQHRAGLYRAEIPRPPDGAYRGAVSYNGPDGTNVEVPAPFVANPPDEWLPQDAASGANNLAAWARAAGGSLTSLEELQSAQRAAEQQQAGLLGGAGERLLLALVLLWPLEIAIRRRWLPWMT